MKVKAASILPIEKSGIDDLWSALRYSRNLTVVTDDDLQPLFGVEFDGEAHKTEQQLNAGIGKRINCASDFVFRCFESTQASGP